MEYIEYIKPELLILDDSTSALDTDTEFRIRKLLKESALNYGIDPDNHSVDSDKSKDLGKNLPLSQ